jgi:hypothetical protein
MPWRARLLLRNLAVHIIPLKWAHDHGGWRWSAEDKQRFANDYQKLILVNDGRNQGRLPINKPD